MELAASTGDREERILKQRDRKDLKEGSSGFAELLPSTKATANSSRCLDQSTSFSGTSVSFCSKICLRELLWNLLPQQEVAKKEFLNKEIAKIAKIAKRGVPGFAEIGRFNNVRLKIVEFMPIDRGVSSLAVMR